MKTLIQIATLIALTTLTTSALAKWRIVDNPQGGKLMINAIGNYQTGDMNERFSHIELACYDKALVITAISVNRIFLVGDVRVSMWDGEYEIESFNHPYNHLSNPRWKRFIPWYTDHDYGRAYMVTELLNRETVSFSVFENTLHTQMTMLIDNRNFAEVWAEYQALEQCKQIPEKQLVKAKKRFDKRLAKHLKKLAKSKR